MVKKDYEFVVETVDSFFNQSHIRKRMKLIEDNYITGWEIWIQVEFAMFLDKQTSIGGWEREFQYNTDHRKKNSGSHMAIDFIFRKTNSKLDRFIALEIKQNLNVSSCIRGMMEDIGKISLVKSSEDDIRSMWNLGIHSFIDIDELKNTINNYAEKYQVDLADNHFYTQKIKTTNLAFTII